MGAAVLAAGARGEDVLWCRSLGVDQGLSQNFITAMAQDRDGFLWFGTFSGLNRWDGYEFASFRHVHDDPATLGDSVLRALHQDQHG
ncbi:MAG TPA: two-component regulator propeller domain-containing protein, partial [Verrucomicrobiota bacterium]|nr:two-component regulator propeller domain-containing protein [Verrucomicrobiota bacterium]